MLFNVIQLALKCFSKPVPWLLLLNRLQLKRMPREYHIYFMSHNVSRIFKCLGINGEDTNFNVVLLCGSLVKSLKKRKIKNNKLAWLKQVSIRSVFSKVHQGLYYYFMSSQSFVLDLHWENVWCNTHQSKWSLVFFLSYLTQSCYFINSLLKQSCFKKINIKNVKTIFQTPVIKWMHFNSYPSFGQSTEENPCEHWVSLQFA